MVFPYQISRQRPAPRHDKALGRLRRRYLSTDVDEGYSYQGDEAGDIEAYAHELSHALALGRTLGSIGRTKSLGDEIGRLVKRLPNTRARDRNEILAVEISEGALHQLGLQHDMKKAREHARAGLSDDYYLRWDAIAHRNKAFIQRQTKALVRCMQRFGF